MKPYVLTLPLYLGFLTALASCDVSDPSPQTSYPPPVVRTVALKAEDVLLHKEYPGRLLPIRLAEVRARVTGIVLAKTFSEGSDVNADAILFQIDPAKFEAAAAGAKAQLEQANAALALALQQEQRIRALIQKGAASKDQFDIAVATRRQSEAEVLVAKANLRTAELELGYTSVRSPIDGRIGAATVTEGAFVRQEDGTQMATIRDLSSVYVDFTAPLSDLAGVRRDNASDADGQAAERREIELITNDGSTFSQPGRLLFSSAVVNETTGQVSLRAEFSNPDKSLLPGTYVRVRMTQGITRKALLVPQRAVQWDTLGQAKVLTVRDGKAVLKPIVTSQSVGNRLLVTQGLKAGDEVIVDGVEKATPGSAVAAQALDEKPDGNAALHNDCVSICDQQAKL
ncbi:efflux RND transporter periplasmic adaptor subunit [Rhizobium sp.]